MSGIARIHGAVNDHTHIGAGSGLATTYYIANCAIALGLSTAAPSANVLRAMPFVAPRRGGALDTLAFEITVSVAGNTRIGLYTNTAEGNDYPATLLDGSGSIVNGVAFQTFAVTRRLVPGALYWLAIVSDANSTIRALGLGSCGTILGASSTALINVGISVAFAYAALPATFTAGGAYITAAPIPALYAKFSA